MAIKSTPSFSRITSPTLVFAFLLLRIAAAILASPKETLTSGNATLRSSRMSSYDFLRLARVYAFSNGTWEPSPNPKLSRIAASGLVCNGCLGMPMEPPPMDKNK